MSATPEYDRTVAELEGDIADLREDLAETVTALHDKLAVRRRVHRSLDHARDELEERALAVAQTAQSHRGALTAAAIGFALSFTAVALWRRKH